MVHVNSNKLSVIGWVMNVYVSGKLLFLDETGSHNRNVHSKHGYRAPRVNQGYINAIDALCMKESCDLV